MFLYGQFGSSPAASRHAYTFNLDRDIPAPSTTGLFWELPYGEEDTPYPNRAGDWRRATFFNATDQADNPHPLHKTVYNYAFADGHVTPYRPEDTLGDNGTWTTPKGFWTRDPKD